MRRPLLAFALVLATGPFAVGSAVLRAQARESEERLKAAFISKFPQFVEWPAEVIDGRAQLDICVAGTIAVRSDLQALVSGETLNGRAIVVREIHEPSDAASCHLLYIAQRGSPRVDLFLRAVGSSPVLTISDRPDFLNEGGIIGLRVIQGRVRFEVHVGTAQRAGLRIGSQLLQLALSVRGGGRS